MSWRNSIGCASEVFASGARVSQLAQSAELRKAGDCSIPVAGRLKFIGVSPVVGAVICNERLGKGAGLRFH